MYTCTCTHTCTRAHARTPSTHPQPWVFLSPSPPNHTKTERKRWSPCFLHTSFVVLLICGSHNANEERVVPDSPVCHNNNKSAQHRWGLDTRPCYCRGNRARETGPPVAAKQLPGCTYGVATISSLLKNYWSLLQNIVSFIGLFCKRDL